MEITMMAAKIRRFMIERNVLTDVQKFVRVHERSKPRDTVHSCIGYHVQIPKLIEPSRRDEFTL